MNLSSLLSGPASSGPQSGGLSAAPSSGSKSSGSFDALMTAKACVADESNSPPAVPDEAKASDASENSPKDVATVSAGTMAMLAALDRSATMLSPSKGAAEALGKDEKPGTTDAASTADAPSTLPSAQTAALISAFMAVGRALPGVASLPDDDASETNVTTPLASSTPKGALPTPPAVTAPMPALFNAIAAELRPLVGAKADPAGTAIDATFKTAKDPTDGISVVSPTSTMIRDLASLMANSVTPSTPADGVAVDRHLDLARGDAWLNDLANDIAATAANGGRLKFGLVPESLGRLDVEIRQGASGVNVHMMTRTDTARDILTAAQPRIIDEIRAQGVRVAGTEVSTDASGFGGDRAGSTPHQPFGLSIEAALSLPNAVPSDNPKAVVDGRYA